MLVLFLAKRQQKKACIGLCRLHNWTRLLQERGGYRKKACSYYPARAFWPHILHEQRNRAYAQSQARKEKVLWRKHFAQWWVVVYLWRTERFLRDCQTRPHRTAWTLPARGDACSLGGRLIHSLASTLPGDFEEREKVAFSTGTSKASDERVIRILASV